MNDSRGVRTCLPWLIPWLVALAGLGAYANSLGGPFIYDDAAAIVENRSIRQLWPPGEVLWPPTGTPVAGRPVVNLTLAINYRVGGLDVRGYHAVNIAVHVLCALLLYGIVRRTLAGSLRDRLDETAAAGLAGVCALLWAVHPLQAECVNYTTQRTESIMALFYLLTLYCAIRAAAGPGALAWSAASVIACGLGMASKEAMVTAPLMVALYDWAYRSEPYANVLRRRLGLYAGLAATWAVLAVLMAGGPRQATVGFGHGISGWEYALNQAVAIPGYLKLVVWPDPLILDYGFPRPLTIGDTLPYAILLTVLAGAAALLLIRRPPIGYPAAWFFVILAPTSSVVPIATEVAAERRMYLPLAGVIVLLVVAVGALAARIPGRFRPAYAASALAALAAAALLAATWQHNALYGDPVAMWEASAHAVPDNHRARTNLGVALTAAGRLDEAIDQLQEALRLEPDATRAGYNLANALAARGRAEEAITRYHAVIAGEPDSAEAHRHLAIALQGQGDRDGAIRHFREAVRLEPRDPEARYGLGRALAARGQVTEALEHLRHAAGLEPGWAAPAREAAWLLATWPGEAARDGAEAVRLARRAAALTGRGDAGTLDALAAALAEAGRFDDATSTAQEALELAETAGNSGLAEEIRARLELYERQEPYRAAGPD
ncbi:MAG: tetratricopeptide repeat protein [Planctomycetota bacterium]|jgi:tetratricopeptide (TPR) repeat protein